MYVVFKVQCHKHYGACVVETRPHRDAVESADAVDIQGRSVSCLVIFFVPVIIPLSVSPLIFTSITSDIYEVVNVVGRERGLCE